MSLSEEDDLKWHESWDDDWDFLYDNGYIDMEADEIPYLTEKGQRVITHSVTAAGNA